MTYHIRPRTYDSTPRGALYARQPSLADQREMTPIIQPVKASEKWIISYSLVAPNYLRFQLQEFKNHVDYLVSTLGLDSKVLDLKDWTDGVQIEILLPDRPAYVVRADALLRGALNRFNLTHTDSTLYSVNRGRYEKLGAGGPSVSILSPRSVYSRAPGGRPGIQDVKIRV